MCATHAAGLAVWQTVGLALQLFSNRPGAPIWHRLDRAFLAFGVSLHVATINRRLRVFRLVTLTF